MKLLVFSDIHGNYDAFQVFLKEIKKISYDLLIFCGDIFGYYYEQTIIIEKMQELKHLIWILGNHDQYAIDMYDSKIAKDSYIERFGHCYENIIRKSEIINVLREKQSCYCFYADNKKIGIYHGTPDDSLEGRLYPDNIVVDTSAYEKYDIVILGHTHCRMKRMIQNTLVINSGSLGQPRDGNEFGYAIIDTETNDVVFKDITIDTSHLYKQIERYDKNLYKLKEVLERRGKLEKNIGNSN